MCTIYGRHHRKEVDTTYVSIVKLINNAVFASNERNGSVSDTFRQIDKGGGHQRIVKSLQKQDSAWKYGGRQSSCTYFSQQ